MHLWFRRLTVSLLLFSIAGQSQDSDIDVAAARARYNEQRLVADRAKQDYESASARLQPYLSSLASARARLQEADARVARANQSLSSVQARIARVNSEIQNLQSANLSLHQRSNDLRRDEARQIDEINRLERNRFDAQADVNELEREIREQEGTGDWRCVYVDHGHEEHGGGHPATSPSRSTADAEAKAACLAVHGSCDLAGCSRTSPDLDQLRRRLANARSRLTNIESEMATAERRLRDIRYSLDQNRSEEYANNQKISSYQQELNSLSYERSNLQNELSSAQRDRSTASSDVQRSQADVDHERPIVERARSDMQREEAEASSRYAYLQQVTANYEAEKQNAINLGSSTGSSHGDKEALERASPGAQAAGKVDGAASGRASGETDAKEKSYVKGYVVGRRDGASDSSLSARYQVGLAAGLEAANRKALLEKLPEGYNSTFQKLLPSIPPQSQTVDITDHISSDPGGTGGDLRSLHKDSTTVAAPAYPIPAEPGHDVPSAPSPTVAVPLQDSRYNQPPCDGLRRAEFVSLCRQSYAGSYASGFAGSYRSVYDRTYKASFAEEAAVTYDQTFGLDHPAETLRGRLSGAEHLGVLTGFATRLPGASQEYFQKGVALLEQDLAGGHLVLARSVSLDETSGDGILQPGETLKLSVVLDNHGKQASPLDKIRVKISNTVNAKSVSVALRRTAGSGFAD